MRCTRRARSPSLPLPTHSPPDPTPCPGVAPCSRAWRWSRGYPGPAEASGDPALSGPDGVAAGKALEALGYSAAETFFTLSRPEPGMDAPRRVARLRAQIEAVDPAMILAVDDEAADDVSAAFGVRAARLGQGDHRARSALRSRGRTRAVTGGSRAQATRLGAAQVRASRGARVLTKHEGEPRTAAGPPLDALRLV